MFYSVSCKATPIVRVSHCDIWSIINMVGVSLGLGLRLSKYNIDED